jgi:Tfp pilus assembly protein PilF
MIAATELGAESAHEEAPRVRLVPATLVAIMQPPGRQGGALQRVLRGVLAAAVWLGLTAALGPVAPSVNDDLAAAARARAVYRYDRALEWYRAAATASPGDARPLCRNGEVRALQHEWTLAVAAYGRCLELRPDDAADAWLGLGDARGALDETSEAQQAWQRAADAGNATAVRRLALAAEAAGRVDDAESAWGRLPSQDVQAREHLGILALWRGNTAAAQADFQAARAQPNPSGAPFLDTDFLALAALPALAGQAWGRLGYAFLTEGTPALALTPLETAVRLAPAGDAAHAYLGWTLWLLSQVHVALPAPLVATPAAAAHELQVALRLNPRSSFAWFASGSLAFAAGELAGAHADYARAVALDAHNPTIWSASGRLALARANYLEAELDLENAARLATRPDESVALLHFYLDHGYGMNTGRALAAATTAELRWPDSELVRALFAQIADGSGRSDLAYYAAQAALSADPSDPGPYVFLGRYAENEGQYVTAAGYLRVALALAPDGPWSSQATALLAPLHGLAV